MEYYLNPPQFRSAQTPAADLGIVLGLVVGLGVIAAVFIASRQQMSYKAAKAEEKRMRPYIERSKGAAIGQMEAQSYMHPRQGLLSKLFFG